MSTASLLERYELSARAQGLSPKSVQHVTSSVRRFDGFLGGITDVRKVTADDLKRFIVDCRNRDKWPNKPKQRGKKLSPTTVNTYTRGIKSFWSFLAREGLISKNPLAAVAAPKLPQKLPKILSEDELRAIFKATPDGHPRNRALLMLFLDSGIRLSEAIDLDLGNVDLKNNTVKVYGKGGKERHAFITTDTALVIDTYLRTTRPRPQADNRLFLTVDGLPVSANRIQVILERIGEQAKIGQRLGPHKLRHTYATLSIKYGGNLEILRRTLGHTDIKTTEKYLHLADADVAEAHKEFSPVANLQLTNGKNKQKEGLTFRTIKGRDTTQYNPDYDYFVQMGSVSNKRKRRSG